MFGSHDSTQKPEDLVGVNGMVRNQIGDTNYSKNIIVVINYGNPANLMIDHGSYDRPRVRFGSTRNHISRHAVFNRPESREVLFDQGKETEIPVSHNSHEFPAP